MAEEKKTNEQIVKEIQAGNEELLNTLIRNNMDWVKKLVSKMTLYNELGYHDEQDLIQVGMIKLMEAAKNYNASKNTKFLTYATICIRGGMIDWMIKNKESIHIPKDMRKKVSEYEEAIEKLLSQSGKYPTDREIKKLLKIDDEELIVIRDTRKVFKVISLDDEIEGEEDEISIVDTIEDKEDKYMELFLEEDKSRMFGLILKLKNEKERKVIIDEYYNDIPKVEIAKEMGVTAQRVQNLKRDALNHLKELLEIRELAKEYGIKVEQLG